MENKALKGIGEIVKTSLLKRMKMEKYSIEALEKAIDVIEYLVNNNKPQPIKQITHSLNLSYNQIFRILNTLQYKGWAAQNRTYKTWILIEKLIVYPKPKEEIERERTIIKDISRDLKKLRIRMKSLLKISEVQEILDISEEEIIALIDKKRLSTINFFGNILIEKDSLIRWLNRKGMKLRECNICHKKAFMGKYERFCSQCKKSDLVRFYKPHKKS